MSSERNMAQRSKTNNMPAGHLKGKVGERFLSAGMWHIAQSSSSGYSSTSRMDDTLAVGTVFGRDAYSKGAHASVLHSKIPRRTRRFQNLQAVLDQAERNSSCAAIGPDDENYRLARQSVRDGALLNPFPLLYVRSQFWHNLKPGEQALCILRGAYEAHPSWTFCLYSAALAHGLSVSYRLVSQVYVRSSRRSPTRGNEYVRRCYTRARADEVTMARGLPVTSLMQTLLDCLIAGPLPDALAITDSALRLYGISKEDLTAFMLVQGKRRPGLRRALEVAALADARAESGGESILRGVIIAEGFMLPTDLQVELPDPTSLRGVFRADMLWELPDGRRVVGELDGAEKYVDERMRAGRSTVDVLLEERQRESRITALGMPVMRFLFRHVREPGYVAHILESFGIPRRW